MALRKPGHYDTLLRVRKRQEEMKAMVLAGTRREIARAEIDRDHIARQQQTALERAAELARESFDARDVRRYYQYERHLARRAVDKDAQVRALQGRAEEERQSLEEAMKQRRIVEKLEERVGERYRGHVNKFEQKIADEAASNSRALARTNGGTHTGEGGGQRTP